MSDNPSPELGSLPVTTWRKQVLDEVTNGTRFAGLFGTTVADGTRLTALLADPVDGLRALDTTMPGWQRSYPALTPDLGAAFWYERELHDLFGLAPEGHPRPDPLVLPLPDASPRPQPGATTRPGPLLPIETAIDRHVLGPGMFTIPHGPVRSGVFESVEYLVETPGEDIPFPQIRVYYKHRGVEKRFEGATVAEGVLLAERTEGIASVAHALAYCHAIEALTDTTIPTAAGLVRVLHAELERIANHLEVVLRLADAAGLAVAVARFGWHKERVLRLVSSCCGNRFGRGVVVPGGIRALPAVNAIQLRAGLTRLAADIRDDERILMMTSSFLDRLRGTGPLNEALATSHGALGPIGRASGRTEDVREVDQYDGYRHLEGLNPPHSTDGDVMARLRVRWAEIHDAFELTLAAVDALGSAQPERIRHDPATLDSLGTGRGIGRAEAPQGEVTYVVEIADGHLTRAKPRSASFHNLPLFHSVFAGDILTDFPFIEASFGLSIAGVVL